MPLDALNLPWRRPPDAAQSPAGHAPVVVADPVKWLELTTRPGDLVLTGGRGGVSRLIQRGTRSDVSHVAIVASAKAVVEAYDYGLTPDEQDEGVFETSFSELVDRSHKLDRIVVRRPDEWCERDQAELRDDLLFALSNSPPFPTAGTVLTGALVLLAQPALRWVFDLGGTRMAPIEDRVAGWMVRVVGDGNRRVHCAELVTRLYAGAGLELCFVDPVLGYLLYDVRGGRWAGDDRIAVDRSQRRQLASLTAHLRRRARRSARPTVDKGSGSKVKVTSRWDATGGVVRASVSATGRRIEQSVDHRPDLADLVLPADYVRAEPFTTVASLTRRGTSWIEESSSDRREGS